MITVLVVDPIRLFREGIRTLIKNEPDINVVGMAETTGQAILQVTELKPDVVLMDVDGPNYEAIQTCTKIRDINPDTKVVYLTEKMNTEVIFRGIANGADGYLLKELYPDMLCQAIRDAARGQHVISGEVAKTLVNYVRKLTTTADRLLGKRLENKGIHLTKRELEIATLLAKGYSNMQISKQLHLSEGTVKNYISVIYLKLGVRQREKAVKFLQSLV